MKICVLSLLLVAMACFYAEALPAREPADIPAREPADVPAREPTDVPAREPADVPALEPTDVPALEPTDVPALEPADVPALEPADEKEAGDALPAPRALMGTITMMLHPLANSEVLLNLEPITTQESPTSGHTTTVKRTTTSHPGPPRMHRCPGT
ncbi:uncharacterized protein [Macrobrachium rosenbergii]|uniref:uncharacterized protein n=1 Tax=Macrobrachium rosenbergii TaxID=79674 RepID=UPI0034D42E5E